MTPIKPAAQTELETKRQPERNHIISNAAGIPA
jgi:hypothetical protein